MRKEKEVKQAFIRSITRDRKTSHWVPVSRGVYPGKRRARLHCAFTPTDHLPECSENCADKIRAGKKSGFGDFENHKHISLMLIFVCYRTGC